MYQKKFRPAVYAMLFFEGQIVLAKKIRGPFEGTFDLIGGGLEHGETFLQCLEREIREEVGIDNFEIEGLLNVFSHVVKFESGGKKYDQHSIGIVYKAKAFQKPSQGFDDCGELIFLSPEGFGNYKFSPICSQAIEYIRIPKKYN